MGDEERRWTDENIDTVALKHFPNIDKEKALNRPILYSNWLSKVKLEIYLHWELCFGNIPKIMLAFYLFGNLA